MKDYSELYSTTWNSHSSGLKVVLGGTGIGKTSGMREAIQVDLKVDSGRKFIYCTYRHNLLQEQAKDFEEKGVRYAYLKSQKDTISSLLEGSKLEKVFEGLRKGNVFGKGEKAEKASSDFQAMVKKLRGRKKILENNHDLSLKSEWENEFSSSCAKMMRWFKFHIENALKSKEEKKKLLMLPEVWSLFPYVQFKHDPQTKILLGTIHKFLMGFFDGVRNLKLASIEDTVIFLDEFDFLEGEILKVIASENSIQNPIEFVRFFYEDFEYWSKMDFWTKNSTLEKIHQRFSEIKKRIDSEFGRVGFSFPEVRLFRSDPKDFKGLKLQVFETAKAIVSRPFFIEEKDGSWWLSNDKRKGQIWPPSLFYIFKEARDKIIGVFNTYRNDQAFLEEIIQFIWNNKNDGKNSVYSSYIMDHIVYHRSHEDRINMWEALKKKPEVTGYDLGYRMFRLRPGLLEIDDGYVELDQLELLTSPESIVAKLADNNLVFGLSATSDIPRLVKSFDMKWLKENIMVHEFSKADFQMLARQKNKKKEHRKTKVCLEVSGELQQDHPWESCLKDAQEIGFFQNANTTNDSGDQFRRERVSRALKIIFDMSSEEKGQSHLVFLSSFHALKQLITGEELPHELESLLAELRKVRKVPFGYEVEFNGKIINIQFFNSALNKEIQLEENDKYKEFFKAKKVFVITQYNSASNGVNLPCFDEEGKKKDFDGVHLADGQYFWLPVPEQGSTGFKTELKTLYWNMWKLKHNTVISEKFFRALLNLNSWGRPNAHYQRNVPEKVLNNIALYYQAIGRVERSWKTTRKLHVTVSSEVAKDLKTFLLNPEFKKLREDRVKSNSSTVESINKLLLSIDLDQQAKEPGVFYRKKDSEGGKILKTMAKELAKLREGSTLIKSPNEVKAAWVGLRENLLLQNWGENHEFQIGRSFSNITIQSDFCISIPSNWNVNKLFCDSNDGVVYRERAGPSDILWCAGWPYIFLAKNPVIRQYFQEKEYALENPTPKDGFRRILSPFIEQTLLKGVLGEAGLQALFEDKEIAIESMERLPDSIFEEVDFQVAGQHVFIDAKNYSGSSIDAMSLSPGDLDYKFDLDSSVFLKRCQKKLRRIKAKTNLKAQLAVVNLFAPQNARSKYLNEELVQVESLKEAALILIPGALHEHEPQKYTASFELFTTYLTDLK